MDVGNKQVDRRKRKNPAVGWVLKFGAGNEIRTRDPDLGKVVLYQLSYSRNKRGTSFEVVRILQKFWGNATFNSTFFAPQCLNA